MELCKANIDLGISLLFLSSNAEERESLIKELVDTHGDLTADELLKPKKVV